MKYIYVMVIFLSVLFAQDETIPQESTQDNMMQEQLDMNVKKALDMHSSFQTEYWQNIMTETDTLLTKTEGKAKDDLMHLLDAFKSNTEKMITDLATKQSEFIQTESQKYMDAFAEIKNQGTPEVMLMGRAVALAHSLFHILQKNYEEERRQMMNAYFSYIEEAMRLSNSPNIEKNLATEKEDFELEESIKKRSHNVTHTFQVLREFEFTDMEKKWIFDRMDAQIIKEENQRVQTNKMCDALFLTYLETAKNKRIEEFENQELSDEQKTQYIDKASFIKASLQKFEWEEKAAYEERKAKYLRDLAMYTERRLAGLQREIYYFKSFIDAEVNRYRDTEFPQSIISELQQRHWNIFLEMTDTNLKRWLEEDRILLLKYIKEESKNYHYSESETEEAMKRFLE